MSKSGGFETKFAQVLDSIDGKSRNLEKSFKERFSKKEQTEVKKAEEKTEKNNVQSNLSKDIRDQNDRSISLKSRFERLDFKGKLSSFRDILSNLLDWFSYRAQRIWASLPFIIPPLVIFQTALWLVLLSENSIIGEIIQNRVGGFGDATRKIAIFLSIFGALGAYLFSSSFDNNLPYGEFSILPEVVDVMFILLVISSILYFAKKTQSLFYLNMVIVGSLVIRLIEVDDGTSYNELSIFISTTGLFLFSVTLSIPILRHRRSLIVQDSTIDISLLEPKSENPTEYSYHDPYEEYMGIPMDQAPVSKPRRPSRRSEYELYEWVLLLANLILWPSIVVISIIIGSGTEVAGGTYNLEENYLMLIAPLLLTLFFFNLLYKMDSNARDGSLYLAEKQSYLDEMEKYLEARTAYLELVTLQAKMKKEEMVSSNSEE